MRTSPCCRMMADNLTHDCDQHEYPWQCPDSIIAGPPWTNDYGIRVHDGGSSYIVIRYCPWCAGYLGERCLTCDWPAGEPEPVACPECGE